MPREFVKDGTQFINRCTYVAPSPNPLPCFSPLSLILLGLFFTPVLIQAATQ